MFSVQRKIKQIYRTPKDSIYSHRFWGELASGYSHFFNNKGDTRDFFSFEPGGCKIEKLLKVQCCHCSSHNIEMIISKITYSLMAYGRAYIYFHPEYFVKKEDDGTKTQALSSFEIGEILGVIKKRTKEEIVFVKTNLNFETNEIHMLKKQLVIFDINELGFSKNHFTSLLKRLSKCDISLKSVDMMTNFPDMYDFEYHSERAKFEELKILRKIGWSFGNEGLSDSYILYKKIKLDELKLRFLEYIVKKINDGLHEFLGNDTGELVAHIDQKNYRQLWDDYSDGKITSTQLADILFRN